MKINNDSYFTIFMIVISFAAAAYAMTQWDFKTAVVPALCGGGTFILSSFQLFRELRGKKTKTAQIMDTGFDKNKTTERENMVGAIKYFGILVGLFISIYIIGIYPSIGVFVVLYLLASGEVSLVKSIVVAAAIVGVVYFIISEVAQEALPDPLLYRLLS